MPWNRKQPYDMRKIIAGLADRGSIFELQPQYGAALITSLCRMDGDVVGVVGNQPLVRAGSFDAEEADKATHFIQVCNAFHIPMVFLADTPGFMVGPKAEGAGLLRRGMRVAHVLTQMRVPAVSVAIRKVYGMGGNAMNGIGNEQLTVLAWPTTRSSGRCRWKAGSWRSSAVRSGNRMTPHRHGRVCSTSSVTPPRWIGRRDGSTSTS